MTLPPISRGKLESPPNVLGFALGIVCLLVFIMSAAGNEKTLRVTTKQNGSSVSLQQGDLLEVTLPSALGTGFSWRVRNGAENVLETAEKPTVTPDGEKDKTGKTEYQIFQFKTKAAGTGKLELEYVRPWEKDTPPTKTFLLTVHVR